MHMYLPQRLAHPWKAFVQKDLPVCASSTKYYKLRELLSCFNPYILCALLRQARLGVNQALGIMNFPHFMDVHRVYHRANGLSITVCGKVTDRLSCTDEQTSTSIKWDVLLQETSFVSIRCHTHPLPLISCLYSSLVVFQCCQDIYVRAFSSS